MQFDLGLQGLAILAAFSVAFGAVTWIVGRSASPWVGIAGGLGWFGGGLFLSEVMFATATEAELQPIIDGLAFDESLLGGLIVGTLAALMTWFVARAACSTGLTSI